MEQKDEEIHMKVFRNNYQLINFIESNHTLKKKLEEEEDYEENQLEKFRSYKQSINIIKNIKTLKNLYNYKFKNIILLLLLKFIIAILIISIVKGIEKFKFIRNNTFSELIIMNDNNSDNQSNIHKCYRIINNIYHIDNGMKKFKKFVKDYKNQPVDKYTLKSFIDDNLPIVNIIDCNGNTPLVYAIKNPSFSIVEALIEKGANVNNLNKKNNSDYNTINLIFKLIIKNENKILIKLLDAGLNPNIRNSKDQNLLDMAFIANDYEIYSYLIKHYIKDIKDFNIQNISFSNLGKIIKMERLDLLKFLIEEKGLKIKEFSNSNDLSLLDIAFITKNFEMYSYLMNKGLIKFNPINFSFEHLEEIIKKDKLSLIQNLVKSNIDLKDYSKSGDKTIIDVAFKTNSYKMYSYLLRYGLTDFKRESVTFHHVENIVKNGQLDLLEILVNNNVDLTKFTESERETLLNIASNLKDKEIKKYLDKCGVKNFYFMDSIKEHVSLGNIWTILNIGYSIYNLVNYDLSS